MNPLIPEHFHACYLIYKKDLSQGKPVYLHIKDETAGLELSPVKKTSISEIFQKTKIALQTNFQPAKTTPELEKQIIQLNYLLTDGQELISRYRKQTHTWCRRFLKLIHSYAPKILKNHFPRFFNNKIQEAEQKTQQAYQQFRKAVQMLKNELENKCKVQPLIKKAVALTPSKTIADLPDALLLKIFKDNLSRKERAHALGVCGKWNTQIKNSGEKDRLIINKYMQSILESLNEEQSKAFGEQLRSIQTSRKINNPILTLEERKKSFDTIFARYLKNRSQ